MGIDVDKDDTWVAVGDLMELLELATCRCGRGRLFDGAFRATWLSACWDGG